MTALSEAARSGLGFLQWGDALSGSQVLVGPCHFWWGLFWGLVTFGSGGVRSNNDSNDFRLLTLWSVHGCRIACCVHHSAFRFTAYLTL